MGVLTDQDKVRRWLDFVFLALVLSIFAVISSQRLAAPTDPDVWWHIRIGDWIIQHGGVPYFDVFSYTTYGKPWVEYAWLFDLLVSIVFKAGGSAGILLFTSVLVMINMAGLTALLARYTHLPRAAALALLAYVVAVESLGTPRPWLFTIGFFTVELWLLLLACEGGRWAWLSPIIPMMALWANIHVQFVYGLALLGLFAVLQSIPGAGYPAESSRGRETKRSAWPFWLVLVASCLATLANPYGWRVYTVVYEYATQKCTLMFIAEMQSPTFRAPLDFLVLGLVCGAWFVAGISRKRSILLLVLLAAATACAFRTTRDMWFVALIGCVVLAQWWGTSDRKGLPLGIPHWLAAVAFSLVLIVAVPGIRVSDVVIAKWMRDLYPVEACNFIEKKHLLPPLYNSYTWGGYIMWRLPQLPVSMDGRTNVHADEQVIRAMDTTHGEASWAEDKELFGAKTILLERKRPLVSILRADARFRVVYEDRTSVVFGPTGQSGAGGSLNTGQQK